ncbi:acyl-CoA reductase [Luedemannella helvata]|uniref:Acyl-CoA reductase n=1 Tax=Luedemannella helvata TaxID=349315 RepID=A0ABP4WZC2_9ACTN
MKLTARFPAGPDVAVEDVLASVLAPPLDGPLRVGDPRVVDFLTSFARRLLAPAVARRYPELASLGFFLRRGELTRALAGVASTGDVLVFPRGLVFHVPPANVDTIFVYSWALSALAGNPNVVRVSARAAGAASAVLDALNDALADAHPAVAQTQRMVTYGRDDEITAALSAACDLRVIWGGDASVRAVRRAPLAPWSRDVTFPDRSSFAAVSVPGWAALSPHARRTGVAGFANDSYWFDQAACASPRTLFLIGGSLTEAAEVRADFVSLLVEEVASRGWPVDPAMAVEKRVATYGLAAAGLATRLEFSTNAVAMATLDPAAALPRTWLGAGTFPVATLDSLASLAPLLGRRDQTLSHLGFLPEDLHEFARSLGGRAIDRIVPFGRALTFGAVWDGYDLLHEFTRRTTLTQ